MRRRANGRQRWQNPLNEPVARGLAQHHGQLFRAHSRTLVTMHAIVAAAADALIFILLAWGVWRLLGRSIPIAVVPIIIGLVLAATGWLPPALGVPSAAGDKIGWVGVLLLAFTAGLETRQSRYLGATAEAPPGSRVSTARFTASAAIALILPFSVGALAAYYYFAGLPNWAAPNGDRALGAIAIGLCIAVSALPVLIGIVRELGPLHRSLTQVAIGIAVVDDAVLWIGQALLLLVAGGNIALTGWSGTHLIAAAVPVLLAVTGMVAQRRRAVPPKWVIWLLLPI